MNADKKIVSELNTLSKDELIDKIIKLRSGAVASNNFDNVYINQQDNLSHLIVENSHDGIMIIGDNFNIEFVNSRITELTGYSKETLINRDFRELLNESNKDLAIQRYINRRKNGDTETIFELPLITQKKEHKIFEIKSTLFNDSEGKVKTLSQFKDITIRKQTEEAIIQSEERFRSIVEYSHQGIIVIDTNYCFEYVNDKFSKIINVPREELLGQDFRKCVSEESLDLVVERYKKRQQGLVVPHEYEIILLRPSGEKRNIKLSSSIVNVGGNISTIAQLLDITEAKKNEKVESVILNISQAVNEVNNLKDFLHVVRSELSGILDTTNFYVALHDKASDTYTFPYHVDEYDSIDDITQVELKNSLTDYVRRNNNAILVDDIKQLELEQKGEIKGIVGEACPVWLGAPLVVEKDVVGAICLQNYHDPNCFSENDLELLKIVSENVSSAIWKKQIVDQLKESELRYRDFISRSSEGIYRIDYNPPIDISLSVDEQVNQIIKNGFVGECNNSFARMYGAVSYKNMLGKNLNALYGNKITKENYEANAKFINNNYKIIDVETIEQNVGGQQIIVLNNSIGIVKNGFLENIWGIQKDITESRKLRNILQQIAEGVSSSTGDTFFKSLVQFLGNTLEVDYAFIAQLSDDKKSATSLAFWGEGKFEENFTYKVKHTPSQFIVNSKITVQVSDIKNEYPAYRFLQNRGINNLLGRNLISSNGEVIGLLVILQKGDFKNIEFTRSILEIFATRSASEIERLMQVKEIVTAKEEAERSNRLKSDFLAQMSHEIRTPVNTILSFSSLLKENLENKLDDELKDSFKIIENGGRRLIRTIDLILNVSQIQSGSLTLDLAELNLITIINNLISEFAQEANKKKLELTFSTNYEELNIFADNYSITQIFANLIHNAIKYTNKGIISLTAVINAQDEIIVEVKDSGVGISDEYLNELFDPFSQEETGYTRKFEGTGLGLTLVRKYCDLNNAEIFVSSKKNEGSTFTVKFKK